MIVIDTSAFIAILQGEPERIAFMNVIGAAEARYVSALTVFETSQVTFARRKMPGLDEMWKLIAEIEAAIIPFDEAHARIALDAFKRYGKGFHPARLNLGDCASYALAKSLNAPLLFKGDDFTATDIVAAAPGDASSSHGGDG